MAQPHRATWIDLSFRGTVIVSISLALAGCSADLKETVGPLIPVPNVTGLVVREDLPVTDRKVKLIDAPTDSLFAEDRTDLEGRFDFSEVGAGDWILEVRSTDPGDFAKVTIGFAFASSETTIEVPALDLSLGGLEMLGPEEGASVPVPGFSTPLTFTWTSSDRPGSTTQVRVTTLEGGPVWYSDSMTAERVVWNGLGNRGDFTGRAVPPGGYQWRLRMEIEGSTAEWNMGYRDLMFTAPGP